MASKANAANARVFDLLLEQKIREARTDFYAYRQLMNPNMKAGWWQREVAAELQQFIEDFLSGKKPKLVIEAPPQHGKSLQIIDLISWLAGKDPDKSTIYTSFSERLGIRANLRLQRTYDSEMYQRIFPGTQINRSRNVTAAGLYLRNREMLEYIDREGSFRNTTVRGSITGEGLDLGIIDDPIKGRADANSLTTRNSVWDWFTDDFFTRFSEDGAFLAVLTRWHIDDPIGRFVEKYSNVKVLSYPALAKKDEKHRKKGEPLFPEHKSLEFLLERKEIMASNSWESLYQQSPFVKGGEIIKGSGFGRYTVLPKLKYRACFGDTAQKKKEANDYQVAGCFGLGVDGYLYIIDLMREKFEAYELEKRFPDFWNKQKRSDNGRLRYFGIEDKSSGTELIQRMQKVIKPKIPVKAIPRSIDKLTRVQDNVGFIESGYVLLPEGAPWIHDFIAECEAFTADDAHDHDDQIDVLCDAISNMLHNSSNSIKDML
jgi:predicted phage terminase large subunit-like protein